MLSPMIKTYFAKRMHIDPSKLVIVSVTPCTAKKAEISRPEQNAAGRYWQQTDMRDTDYCITTRELAGWIKEKKIDFDNLENAACDTVFCESSGGGELFGNSGGLMEAVLRTLVYLKTNKPAEDDFLRFEAVRGLEGVKEAALTLDNDIIRVVAVSGLANARRFINLMEEKHSWKKYALIEVMACPGGCIGGGGQPRTPLPLEIPAKRARIEALYQLDAKSRFGPAGKIRNYRHYMRNSWESPAAICPKRCFTRSTSINITFWERKTRFSPFSNKRKAIP